MCDAEVVNLQSKHFAAIAILAVVIVASTFVFVLFQPEEEIILSHHENDVFPYPHFYRMNVTVEAREGKDAYLRVQMAIRGLPGGLSFWTTHALWDISLWEFDLYYEPENETAMQEFSLARDGGREYTTGQAVYDYLWDNPVAPGSYVYVDYYEVVGDPGYVVAQSVTAVVSIIYR